MRRNPCSCPYPRNYNSRMYNQGNANRPSNLMDYGPEPFVINIEKAVKMNNNFRTALWTGTHLQVTLMSINAGEDIGLEMHPDVDQFLRIEDGQGVVRMGDNRNNFDYEKRIFDGTAIMIPAGKWHNVINTSDKPLKLYSIYAPAEHKKGTVHATREEALADEHEH